MALMQKQGKTAYCINKMAFYVDFKVGFNNFKVFFTNCLNILFILYNLI